MPSRQPRMTAPTLKVLGALFSSDCGELSGADMARVTKLASGTLYPILLRLEKAGWLASRWEAENATVLGRPRRRFYRMTPLGVRNGMAAFNELQPTLGKVAWA